MAEGYDGPASRAGMADVETEREMSRAEVATYLHEFADKFGDDSRSPDRGENADTTEGTVESTASKTESVEADHDEGTDRDGGATRTDDGDGRVTFTLGNESATVNPPETVEFTVAVDSTAGMLESGAHETVSFTLEWDAEETDDDELGLH